MAKEQNQGLLSKGELERLKELLKKSLHIDELVAALSRWRGSSIPKEHVEGAVDQLQQPQTTPAQTVTMEAPKPE